jgi:hypothetical protein
MVYDYTHSDTHTKHQGIMSSANLSHVAVSGAWREYQNKSSERVITNAE